MPKLITKWSLALLALALVLPIVAQEGHPLKGSWIGVWEGNAEHGNDVLLVLNWDGKAVTGVINPGTDNIDIGRATLDPNGWKVHIEATAKDGQYVIDGVIEELELPNRAVLGTWKSGSKGGKFEIRRQ